jgi:peptidoglycan hydrolase CwlO-like protein
MNEENNNTTQGEKSLVEKLLGVLKKLVSLKDEIRGARRSLRCCSRNERRAARWAAAEAKAAAAEKAAEAKAAEATDKDEKAAAEADAKAAAEAKASAQSKVEAISTRNADTYRERLYALRRERQALMETAKKIMRQIGGYRRRDRKEIKRLMVAVGL